MRPFLLAISLAFLTAQTFAVNEDPYLDSLWAAYRAPGLSTEQRLRTLHEIVDEVRYNDTDSAHHLVNDFLRQATSSGIVDLIALAHRDLGGILESERDNEGALREFRTSIAIWRTVNDNTARRGIATALNSIGIIHKNAGRLDSALMLYRESMGMHLLVQDTSGLVYSHASIARIHEMQGHEDSALYHYQRSGEFAKMVGDERMVGASAGNRANVLERMGRIGPAIDLAYECLHIMEKLGNERGVATTLTTLSSLADLQGDREEALRIMRRANALYTKVGYRQGMMTSGRAIGSMLLTMDKADSSVIILENVLALERELDAKDIMGSTLNRLGEAYLKLDRFDDARKMLNESRSICRSMQDGLTGSEALALMGETEIKAGRDAEALRACNEGLAMAEKLGALSERGMNCKCLYRAHKTLGHGMEAVRYLEDYNTVEDSLVTERNAREVTQREMRYTFGKQQLADSLSHAADVQLMERAAEASMARARQKYKAVGAVALALLIGLAAYFISDRKRRQARFEKDAAQLETQALRSQMNPHFIFNALNSINAFVQQNDSDRASAYLSKFARLMRLVLENSRQAEVPLKDDLEALDLYLNLERSRTRDASGAEKFDYTITVDPDIDQEETLVPPLVIQPFVENAIWHGMAGKEEKGHIALNVTRRGDELVMAIEDDGVGRRPPTTNPAPSGPVKKRSLGTTITQARLDLVQKQKGKPAGFKYIDLPKGTRVEVSLPVGEAA
jgi:tetratricopeptide (TPR) repeat protein/anti-sigma regulatory factor (Ser/Thr protein kinase)